MPTPRAYDKLFADYEKLRLAAIRVCISENAPQCDPAIDALWALVGDFTDADLATPPAPTTED